MTNVLDFPITQFTDYKGQPQTVMPVVSKPIHTDLGEIPNKKALLVGDKCINIVSDKYEIHQPSDIFDQFQKVSNKFGLEIRKTVFNPNNGGLLISARYDQTNFVGDDHDVNLTFYTSHCGKFKTFLTMDMLRIACMNQVPALYRENDRHIFAEKHYRNSLNVDLFGELLADLPTAINTHNEMMEIMRSTSFRRDDFVEFAKDHWKLKKEQAQYESKINKLVSAYNNAPGQSQLEDSVYKAYNAVTYINTHEVRNTPMQNETVMVKNSQDSLKAMEELLAA